MNVVLPNLVWLPTEACGSRNGATIDIIAVHRWGEPLSKIPVEAQIYGGVINFFKSPSNNASAHVVFPGSAVPASATQMVRWSDMAWAEAAYNAHAQDVESADDIWIGSDTEGMAVLARIVAGLCFFNKLPPVWSIRKGFCRHADLGQEGGGHLECPTTDMNQWYQFVTMVQNEYKRGGWLKSWGEQ